MRATLFTTILLLLISIVSIAQNNVQSAKKTRTDQLTPYLTNRVQATGLAVKDTIWFPDSTFMVTAAAPSAFDTSAYWLPPADDFYNIIVNPIPSCDSTNVDQSYIATGTNLGWTTSNVYTCNGTAWAEHVTEEGDVIVNIAENALYKYVSLNWTRDDYPVNNTWYYTPNLTDIRNINVGQVLIGNATPSSFQYKLKVGGGIWGEYLNGLKYIYRFAPTTTGKTYGLVFDGDTLKKQLLGGGGGSYISKSGDTAKGKFIFKDLGSQGGVFSDSSIFKLDSVSIENSGYFSTVILGHESSRIPFYFKTEFGNGYIGVDRVGGDVSLIINEGVVCGRINYASYSKFIYADGELSWEKDLLTPGNGIFDFYSKVEINNDFKIETTDDILNTGFYFDNDSSYINLGLRTGAIGIGSIVFGGWDDEGGAGNTASGYNTMVFGASNNASGHNTIVTGTDNNINSSRCTILGSYNYTDGSCDHSAFLGSFNQIEINSHSSVILGESNNISEGSRNCIIGTHNNITSNYNRILGDHNTNVGGGPGNYLIGTYNIIEDGGGNNYLLGASNTSETGNNNVLIGASNINIAGSTNYCFGTNNNTSGVNTILIGNQNQSLGLNNFCIGEALSTHDRGELVIGTYNETSTGSQDDYEPGNNIFKIGMGNSSQGRDIFKISIEGHTKTQGSISLLDADQSFYFGDENTDGSWRIVRSGNNLLFERRESGVWVSKSTMTP